MNAAPDRISDRPLVSVVVPTRNRPDHAAECLASILAGDDDNFEVLVADQSDDGRTRDVVERLSDPRVRHVPTSTRGASNARNIGIAAGSGPIVAFTDDDCRVDRGWIRAFRSILADDPSVAMVFGRVVKGSSDDPDAQAAEFFPEGTTTYRSLPPVSEPWGISASMAARRSVLERLSGFDARLGPGAPINMGGEDSDLLIRVLADGLKVATTDRTTVTHLGFRSGAHASDLYRGYAYALGAVFMKHLRLRTRPGRGQLPSWLLHFTVQAAWNALRGRRPTGAGFAAGLVKGAVATVRTPIDPVTQHFALDPASGGQGEPGRPMRIAIGIHSLQLGGSQINTVDLAKRLRSRGHDVHLFVIYEEFKVSIAPVVERAGFDLEILPPASSLRRQARDVRDVVDRCHAQVLHVYHEDHWLGPLGAIALRSRPGRALVVTNWMMENNRWLPPWAPLIVGTEALREEATSLLQRGPVWLLEPPVDVERDAPDAVRAAEFRSQQGLGDEDLVCVLVTRVDRLMKLDGILRAVAAMRLVGGREVRLVIVGDGDAMDTVRRAADEANAVLGRDAVILTGAMLDPRPAYDAADAVLAMGGSALRALAFGKPLIVLGEGSFSRLFSAETVSYFLRHGYFGVESGDMSGRDLAEQIESLRDPEVRAKLGEFGASIVRERYALDVIADRLEEMYAEALASPRNALQRWADVAYVLGYDFVHRRVPPSLRQAIRRRIKRLRTA